jgi:uncharacterized protein (DUF302 family)
LAYWPAENSGALRWRYAPNGASLPISPTGYRTAIFLLQQEWMNHMRRVFRKGLAVVFVVFFVTPALGSDYAYERLAYMEVSGLSDMTIEEKTDLVEDTLDLVIDQTAEHSELWVAEGTNGMQYLPFPPVDFDMDGSPDEVVRQIEISFLDDEAYLRSTSLAKVIALPWPVAAYTDDDSVAVIIAVPQAFVSTYFRDASNMSGLLQVAKNIQHRGLVALVHEALEDSGFDLVQEGLPGTILDDAIIADIEGYMGIPITQEFIAPSVALPDADIKDVVAGLVAAFKTPSVPDLNGDGKLDSADEGVFPAKFMEYMRGEISFEEMVGMLSMGFELWAQGYSFQQWAVPRVLDLSTPGRQTFVIELCQRFYAATALSTGLHHAPSMPCAVAVWVENGVVYANLLNPEFIFAYFFIDAGPNMSDEMAQLFSVFPTMVFNEMAGLFNTAVRQMGYDDQVDFHPIPGM